MLKKFASLSVIILSLFQGFAAAQTVTEDRVAFTTSDAPWMVNLDSKNFAIQDQQVKRDNKSGYFLLQNEKDSMTVSLFIEPAVKCKTSLECRDFVWKTGNPAWGKIQDVVQSKIGEVSYFEFYRPTIQNQPVKMLDMYVEFVENGYWVDLHISKVLYKKEDHLLFENYVKSLRFVSKTGKPITESDKSMAAAQKVLEDWVLLWDAGKYKESYSELSPLAKKFLDEKFWFTHWTTERKPFGKLKSRKLLNTSLVKSLNGFPENSGAVFNYQSSFDNKEDIFETFSLILEKDGNWRVGIYTTNE
jgi:Protein of unknown function (DUF4019)